MRVTPMTPGYSTIHSLSRSSPKPQLSAIPVDQVKFGAMRIEPQATFDDVNTWLTETEKTINDQIDAKQLKLVDIDRYPWSKETKGDWNPYNLTKWQFNAKIHLENTNKMYKLSGGYGEFRDEFTLQLVDMEKNPDYRPPVPPKKGFLAALGRAIFGEAKPSTISEWLEKPINTMRMQHHHSVRQLPADHFDYSTDRDYIKSVSITDPKFDQHRAVSNQRDYTKEQAMSMLNKAYPIIQTLIQRVIRPEQEALSASGREKMEPFKALLSDAVKKEAVEAEGNINGRKYAALPYYSSLSAKNYLEYAGKVNIGGQTYNIARDGYQDPSYPAHLNKFVLEGPLGKLELKIYRHFDDPERVQIHFTEPGQIDPSYKTEDQDEVNSMYNLFMDLDKQVRSS